MRHLYWIENEQGGFGAWEKKADAEKALAYHIHYLIKTWGKDKAKQYTENLAVKQYEAVKCPKCLRLEIEPFIESFGMCLRCDELQAELFYG